MVGRTVRIIIACLALLALSGGAWWSYQQWRVQPSAAAVTSSPPSDEASAPTEKIIVGEQAQKNLSLSAKPLEAVTFWKTITIQGMVVDRPGFSDREVVAPAVGAVSQLFHVPGDLVRPGDKLFTLKLASESLQQTQAELFKTNQNIKLAEARRERLVGGGEAIAQARIIEVENEISLLGVSAQTFRLELANRGFSHDDVEGVANGKLLSEVTLVVPPLPTPVKSEVGSSVSQPFAYELQELRVELGEQVQAGQTLCNLSNHELLAVEGRAFRDETSLLERSVQEGWPVEVDFQEDQAADWPPIEQSFQISYIANTIDPLTRTFAFLMPLKNQYKTVDHNDRTQVLWRFRPGQKVRLSIRVEKLDEVFVVAADAVVMEGADAFIFTQNVNTFERKSVHVLYRDRDQVVLANDGSLPTYQKDGLRRTIAAVVGNAAPQLNRMTKAGSSSVPKGFHIHADGSLHKNEEEVVE
jgi:cobalt-zinc-cadmium efflux system membrane fusion protein